MAIRMNGNLKPIGRGDKGHLKRRQRDRGGTQESMGVSLAVTHNIEDIEHEEATSCGQAGTCVEG